MSAPIETTLELWASSLRDVKARWVRCSRRSAWPCRPGCSWTVCWGLNGPIAPYARCQVDARRIARTARWAGDPGPWRQQAILGRGRWSADALRDLTRDYAFETLADVDAVLVIDETGFLKQGKSSCGVGRQYTGSAGKITNCQIGVFAAYVSRHGHAFIDRAPWRRVRHACRRPGRTSLRDLRQRTCPTRSASRPSHAWPSA